MKYIALSLIFVLIQTELAAQNLNTASYQSYKKANEILNLSILSHGNFLEMDCLQFKIQGKDFVLSHIRKPWATVEYAFKGDFFMKDNFNNFGITRSLDKGGYFGLVMCNENDIYAKYYSSRDTINVTGKSAIETIRNSHSDMLPHSILAEAARNRETLSYIGDEKNNEINYNVISFNNQNGKRKLIYVDSQNGLIYKVQNLFFDKQWPHGDVLEETIFTTYKPINGIQFPTKKVVRRADLILQEYEYHDFSINVLLDSSIFEIPNIIEKREAKSTQSDNAIDISNLLIEKVGEHLYTLYLPPLDCKIMVVEFKDSILVIESATNSEYGTLIIDKIKDYFPNKGISTLVLSHYHPYSMGGIRAFVHEGANLVTTKGNEDYVKFIINAPFSLQADSLHLNPKAANMIIINDKKIVFSEDNLQVVIYDIGIKSNHTDEFLISYFPHEKLLFTSDICFVPKVYDEKTMVSSRTKGLYESIVELGIDVENIIQNWPSKASSYLEMVSFEELEKFVLKK